MKIALITDTHIGARNDNEVFNKYFLKFFDDVFFPYLEREDINYIIHLGDLFDKRRVVNWQTLSTWNERFFERIRGGHYCMYVLAGNHDCYYKSTNSINSVREYFRSSGALGSLRPIDRFTSLSVHGESLAELNSSSAEAVLGLVPWPSDDNELDDWLAKSRDHNCRVVFGHLELAGFETMPGHVMESGYDPVKLKDLPLVLSGHYHTRSNKGNIHYLGTPYQITWADHGQKKGFHVLDTETFELEFVENPHQIFFKSYYDDSEVTSLEEFCEFDDRKRKRYEDTHIRVVVKEKKNPLLFDQYLNYLNGLKPASIEIFDDYLDSIVNNGDDEETEIDMSKDTISVISDYIDDIGMSDKKSDLMKLFKELYIEALSSEDVGI